MPIKTFLSVPRVSRFGDIAFLTARFVAGLGLMLHGGSKIQNPFAWMGENAFAPGIFQALAALSEFGGGAALMLGLLTPLASLGIGATMCVAIYSHAVMRGDPFVAKGGAPSFELAAVYLVLSLVFLALGPGKLSLDRAIFGLRAR